MKTSSRTTLLTIGLSLFSLLSAKASVATILRVDLKCFYQKVEASNASVETGVVSLVRLDSKQLIFLAGKAMGKKFPGGTQLKAFPDGSVSVTDSKGDVLADISSHVRLELSTDARLFDGKANLQTGEEHSQSYYPLALIIDLPDIKATVDGVGIENIFARPANRLGVKIVKGSINSDVNGNGTFGGRSAYLVGSLTSNGTQAFLTK